MSKYRNQVEIVAHVLNIIENDARKRKTTGE